MTRATRRCSGGVNGPALQTTSSRVETLCATATGLGAQDRFQEAEALLQRALAIAEESAGVGPATVRQVLAALGTLYHRAGRFADAERCYRRAIGLVGPHPDVDRHNGLPAPCEENAELGTHYLALGSILVSQRRYEEAETAFRQAIAAFEAVSGEESDEVAAAVNELARLLAATDPTVERAGEAADLYERAVRIRRRLLGPSHPLVVSTLHNLALLLDAAGCAEQARSLWAEAEAALAEE